MGWLAEQIAIARARADRLARLARPMHPFQKPRARAGENDSTMMIAGKATDALAQLMEELDQGRQERASLAAECCNLRSQLAVRRPALAHES